MILTNALSCWKNNYQPHFKRQYILTSLFPLDQQISHFLVALPKNDDFLISNTGIFTSDNFNLISKHKQKCDETFEIYVLHLVMRTKFERNFFDALTKQNDLDLPKSISSVNLQSSIWWILLAQISISSNFWGKSKRGKRSCRTVQLGL